ncbi:copine-8-like isoform X1 [Patiria miniata]|uniref:C2 domain-containing protein n=1 Tax=Patiria miniata TaxID=46514 RepID=A0A914B4L8_PATMI|nr:copine-8-like isoform X1 [Patiria miniata]XP_038070749.1 copine-8-like isoform X1 [Patiria miniata]
MAMNSAAMSFQPGTGSVPATRVEITVSCRDLKDKDVMSKSDPMCVLYTTQLGSKEFAEYERTEHIKNTLNPDFVKKFNLTYFFEECQRLKFEIFDVDSPKQKLTAHDFLGKIETTLGEVLGSSNNRLEKPLDGAGKKAGKIIISAEEVSDCKTRATLSFRGHKLDKKDFLGKSDPFMIFYRCNEDNSYTICHKTEVIKNTLNPTWRPFPILVRALCNGDHDRTIKVECFDWDSDGGSHDLIGIFTTNMRQLSTGKQSFELINPKKKAKKKGYKHSGTIELTNCVVEEQPSFLDYIKGGMQINFTVAIDFTASNGNPTHSNSLHYINPYQPNHYELAITSVGEVIQDYDSDKLFPVLGFGAKIPPDGSVSHEFSVNFNPQTPFCMGIPGIMQAYQNCIRSVQLYGPTNFAPIINHVAKFAQAYMDGSNYFILLVITDGVISDMEMTKDAIISASSLPMSIIIIGVGPAEFDAMEELDADKQALAYRGRVAERDIVQFVPFREYIGGVGSGNQHLSQARLAKDVLAEVPDQIIAYMKKRGINPNQSPTTHTSLAPAPVQ